MNAGNPCVSRVPMAPENQGNQISLNAHYQRQDVDMGNERIHSFQNKNSRTPQPTTQFGSRPFAAPVQMKPKEQQTPEELENEAFGQNKFEAFGLQLKEKSGTITPVEQERLGVLQAKMDDFWAQRKERASRFGFDFSKVSVTPREGHATPQLQPMGRLGTQGASMGGQRSHLNSLQQSSASSIQAKLTIGESGDQYEQEADRVASQVVEQINAPASAQSTQGQSIQRQEEPEEEVQAKPEISALQRMEEQKEEDIQAKSTLQHEESSAGGEASTNLESAINTAKGGGQPLDAGLQRSMGQAMGADFTGVKVHTDAQSDQLNQSIQAKAFTTGQDIFFRQGQYNPASKGGQELLAHELTHVVQQNGGTVQRQQSGKQVKSIQSKGLAGSHPVVQRKENKADNAEKLQNSVEFEQRLGRYAFNHPNALTAAFGMNNEIKNAMIPEFDKANKEHQQKLVELFSSKVDDPEKAKRSAGQVQPDYDVILDVLTQGNLREKMTALMNAMFGTFKGEVKEGMEQSVWENLEAKGLNVEKLKRRKKQLKINPGAKDIFRDPGNPLDRKNFRTWEYTKGLREQQPEGERTSKRTVQDLENEGIGLSNREKKFMYGTDSPAGDENLKWEEGGTYWKIKPEHKWVKKVQNKLHMPVIAGPSGTALRMFQIWEYLGKPVSAENLRLALLGWMLTSNDHSFHEIMLTCADYGLPYKGGQEAYHNIVPLSEDELRANVANDGFFPDELFDVGRYTEKISNKAAGFHGDDFNLVTQGQIDRMQQLVAGTQLPDALKNQLLGSQRKFATAFAVLAYTAESPSAYKFMNNVLEKGLLSDIKSKLAVYYFIKTGQGKGGLQAAYESNKFKIKDIVGEAKEHTKMMELGLKYLDPFQGIVYRGFKTYLKPKTGDKLSDSKFFSTSKQRHTAEGFARKGEGRYQIIAAINSKTGRDLGHLSMLGSIEAEVVFPPGTVFEASSNPVKNGDFYEITYDQKS